jgi:hypothetical protein
VFVNSEPPSPGTLEDDRLTLADGARRAASGHGGLDVVAEDRVAPIRADIDRQFTPRANQYAPPRCPRLKTRRSSGR